MDADMGIKVKEPKNKMISTVFSGENLAAMMDEARAAA
jgi:hypothetical protein